MAAEYIKFKLMQVVRHFWQRSDIKGAIDAVRKLPDHSVGIYSRVSSVLLVLFLMVPTGDQVSCLFNFLKFFM